MLLNLQIYSSDCENGCFHFKLCYEWRDFRLEKCCLSAKLKCEEEDRL